MRGIPDERQLEQRKEGPWIPFVSSNICSWVGYSMLGPTTGKAGKGLKWRGWSKRTILTGVILAERLQDGHIWKCCPIVRARWWNRPVICCSFAASFILFILSLVNAPWPLSTRTEIRPVICQCRHGNEHSRCRYYPCYRAQTWTLWKVIDSLSLSSIKHIYPF